MSSGHRSFASLDARARPTIGDTKTSAVKNDHMGWLKCDGRNLKISDYAQLFSVIKYSFGGSGSFFKLPNPQGRVLGIEGHPQDQNDRAEDGGVNIDGPYATDHPLGDISGEEVHQLTLPEIPAHNHDYTGTAARDVSGNTSVNGIHTHTSNAPGLPGTYGLVKSSLGVVKDTTKTSITVGGTSYDLLDITSDEPSLTSAVEALFIDPSGNHRHQIASNGGDQVHNNIQPTMWIGNLFIYGGRQWVAATPQSRALQGPNPVPNSNYYRPQGPPQNLY